MAAFASSVPRDRKEKDGRREVMEITQRSGVEMCKDREPRRGGPWREDQGRRESRPENHAADFRREVRIWRFKAQEVSRREVKGWKISKRGVKSVSEDMARSSRIAAVDFRSCISPSYVARSPVHTT